MKKERKLMKIQKLCKPHVGVDAHIDPKGITLIALVITIIVLLILAGITINLTVGQRGILTRAEEAGKNYQEAAKREDEQLADFLKEADNIIEGINGGGSNELLPENALAKKVEIGDYVAYDPTAGVTDTSKLTYTSPVGTGSSHGNGDSEQTFSVESNTKWRVLSKDEMTGEVVLISENPMQEFTMNGAIGYLYAEQELNEVCKIYGYGTGANTSKTFRYQTGDVVEGLETGTITGSGARSITVDDINQITKYNPNNDEAMKAEGYGQEYTHSIFYPTKTTQTGASIRATARTDKFTAYYYEASQYLTDTESVMYKMLFGNNDSTYWLVSRCALSYLDSVAFRLRNVDEGVVCGGALCGGLSDCLNEYVRALMVRPIVYLKSNIQTSAKDESGAWIISE